MASELHLAVLWKSGQHPSVLGFLLQRGLIPKLLLVCFQQGLFDTPATSRIIKVTASLHVIIPLQNVYCFSRSSRSDIENGSKSSFVVLTALK